MERSELIRMSWYVAWILLRNSIRLWTTWAWCFDFSSFLLRDKARTAVSTLEPKTSRNRSSCLNSENLPGEKGGSFKVQSLIENQTCSVFQLSKTVWLDFERVGATASRFPFFFHLNPEKVCCSDKSGIQMNTVFSFSLSIIFWEAVSALHIIQWGLEYQTFWSLDFQWFGFGMVGYSNS